MFHLVTILRVRRRTRYITLNARNYLTTTTKRSILVLHSDKILGKKSVVVKHRVEPTSQEDNTVTGYVNKLD